MSIASEERAGEWTRSVRREPPRAWGAEQGLRCQPGPSTGGRGPSLDCVTKGRQGFKTSEKPLVLISQEAPGDVSCLCLLFLLAFEHRSRDLRAISALTLVWYRPGIHSAQAAAPDSLIQSPQITCFPGKQAKIKRNKNRHYSSPEHLFDREMCTLG